MFSFWVAEVEMVAECQILHHMGQELALWLMMAQTLIR